MNEERKTRIAEFVESLDEGDISSSTFLLGGGVRIPDGIFTSSNGGECRNTTYDGCNKATNKASCINAENMCNGSTNYGACDNSYKPKPDNIGNCGCV